MTDLVTRFALRSDLHQSPMHANLMRHIGWKVEGKPHSRIFYRSLGPITISKLQRPREIDLTWIKHFRHRYHTFLTYLEPGITTPHPQTKLGIPVEPFAHSCTSLVDLSGDARKVLAGFSQKTRYNIVHTQKKADLTVLTTPLNHLNKQQLDQFFALHSLWSKQKNVIGHPQYLLEAVLRCYAKSGDLHLCYKDNVLVGSLLILYHDSVATYYAAFASNEGYSTYAPTLLTWTAMQQAQGRGCDIFDFGGIYDPRYPKMYKNWQGFTKFKSGFCPSVVSYPPTTLQLFW